MEGTGSVTSIIAVVGGTATGKSVLALDLAERLDGEIINADSMQFYRGMDIGTAKLPADERRGIPHFQLDTLDVTEDATVATYQRDARADVDAIHARGRRAIVVGGSGLYIRALLDRFEFPATNPAIRERLESRAEIEGPGVLYRELAIADPKAAAKIQPQNAKRIVRALEVIEITGAPFSASLPTREYVAPAIQVGVRLPYSDLDPRIDARVRRMWDLGLVGETRRLVDAGLKSGTTARRAVGYAETLRHLDGELSAEQTKEMIAQHTRRLARRQHRWFGPDSRVRWVDGPVSERDQQRVATQALEAIASLDA